MDTNDLYIEVEGDLNEEAVDDLTQALEQAINVVMHEHSNGDIRTELLTVLMSFAAQVGIDLFVEKGNFIELASELYEEIERAYLSKDNKKVDISKLN